MSKKIKAKAVSLVREAKKTCPHCSKKRVPALNDYCNACLEEVTQEVGGELRGRQKCPVAGCQNHTDQGEFVGSLCFPCHRFLSSAVPEGRHSQAYRNEVERFNKKVVYKLTDLVGRLFEDRPTRGRVSLADLELEKLIKDNSRG